MNNILIFSDLHINQSSLKECTLILEEIGMLANKYNCDTLINLGDTFDNYHPTSQEMDILATWIKRMGKNKKHIIIAADSHESTTHQDSILKIYDTLSDNVKVVKEFKDENHLYCGHFSLKESSMNYDAKISKIALANYIYVFLGHIHSYEIIKPNICHLGSCRYVSFSEANDKHKIITLIEKYGTNNEQVHFLKLKNPIPMVELQLDNNAILGELNDTPQAEKMAGTGKGSGFSGIFKAVPELITYLDNLDPKTKVKVKILDFENFKEFIPFCHKYNTKFLTFKYETNFEMISTNIQNCIKTEMITFKESFTKWLNQKGINKDIKQILEKEIQ